MIRSFMPLDVFDLLVAGKALSNKARTRESFSGKDARFGDLANMVFGWFNPRQRSSAWVSTEGLALKGLASVTHRYSSRSWDVNRLMVADQDHGSCLKLLEHVSSAAGQQRIGRIFISLPAESTLQKPAQETGFLPYYSELLYCRESDGAAPGPTAVPHPGCRPAARSPTTTTGSSSCISSVPHTRSAGPRGRPTRSGRPTAAGAWDRSGCLREMAKWWAGPRPARAADSGLLDIPAVTREDMQGVVEYGLSALGGCQQAFCLVTDSDATLQRLLEDRGFARVTTYSALVKELLVRVVEPYVMPVVPA